jgi:hypothetical protein
MATFSGDPTVPAVKLQRRFVPLASECWSVSFRFSFFERKRDRYGDRRFVRVASKQMVDAEAG